MTMNCYKTVVAMALVLAAASVARGGIKVAVDHNAKDRATPEFKFRNIPSPSAADAATHAKFLVVDGYIDQNSGGIQRLHDGRLPTEADQPAANFFFDQGTEGGRLLVDLGTAISIRQINTYSWHPNTRGPQVYQVYGSDGTAADFNARPRRGTDPETVGWKLLAKVNTLPASGEGGGQYGVSVSDADGAIGTYRYLLFNIIATEDDDDFGNTFYSEIDVIAQK